MIKLHIDDKKIAKGKKIRVQYLFSHVADSQLTPKPLNQRQGILYSRMLTNMFISTFQLAPGTEKKT